MNSVTVILCMGPQCGNKLLDCAATVTDVCSMLSSHALLVIKIVVNFY